MKNAGALVVDFTDIDASMLSLVGGKALNLGLLTRESFPVPRGFCLSTAAYSEACGKEPVSRLVDELAAVDGDDTDAAARLASDIRHAIAGAAIPDAVESAIRAAYATLEGGISVAVRSSADAEDLPSASFAGQQETVLNALGIDSVIHAVRRCWASLWTDRAVNYRARMGLSYHSVRMAVIIQTMVPARVSGVLFTANPLTGRRREAVIDANFGLGESVVSGAVNPDHFVVSLASGEIRERLRGDKLLQIRSLPGGGTERHARSQAEDRLCLTDEEVRNLALMGEHVEQVFGGPQDVEWAIDETGGIWLTQARAITTLFPVPPRLPDEAGDLRVYYSVNASQGMEQSLTPLGSSLLRLLVSAVTGSLGFPPPDPLAGPSFVKEAAGRLFLDVTRALRSSPGRSILLAMTVTAEARAGAAMRGLAENPAFSLNHNDLLPFLWRGVVFLVRLNIPFRLAQSLVDPRRTRARILTLRGQFQRIAQLSPDASPEARLRTVVRLFSQKTIGRLLTIIPATALPGMACISLARKLLGSLAVAGELDDIQRGLADNFTTEMGLELYRVACQIQPEERHSFLATSPGQLARLHRDGSLPPPVQRALDSFLMAYGHRCAAELDGGLKRWSEDPTPVFAIVANYIRGTAQGRASDFMFRDSFVRAEGLVQELVRRARSRGRLRAWLVSFCLRRARSLLGFREAPRFYLAMLLDLARRILLPLGEKLAHRHLLAAQDDLSFLSLNEVFECVAGKDFRSIVAVRQKAHERDMMRHAPAVLLSDGSVPETEEHSAFSSPSVLHGVAASAGIATGIARVILDPTRSRVDPGEILVAPSTDPGWTPLFLTAGALVTETGGPMAHGAIVAREYGIPAVVGVPGATERISSGMRVTVDGANGTVTIESETSRENL